MYNSCNRAQFKFSKQRGVRGPEDLSLLQVTMYECLLSPKFGLGKYLFSRFVDLSLIMLSIESSEFLKVATDIN